MPRNMLAAFRYSGSATPNLGVMQSFVLGEITACAGVVDGALAKVVQRFPGGNWLTQPNRLSRPEICSQQPTVPGESGSQSLGSNHSGRSKFIKMKKTKAPAQAFCTNQPWNGWDEFTYMRE